MRFTELEQGFPTGFPQLRGKMAQTVDAQDDADSDRRQYETWKGP